jgi:ABC-type uncharacterized transport system permease subunit
VVKRQIKKPLNPPTQGFVTVFMGTGLFKIFLGKLLLPYAFDSLWKVLDLLFTAINYTSKTLLESCLSAVITAITFAV